MSQASEYGVSESGVVFWNVRDRFGRFVSRKVFEARQRAVASRARLAQRRADYNLYLEARLSAAEAATRGHLLRDWSLRSDVARIIRRGVTANATQELADWLEENGRTLTYREFSDQMAEEMDADQAEAERWDRLAA